MSQDEGMSESPVETLEKAVGLGLIWTGGITSLSHLERHTESNIKNVTMPYSSCKWIGIPRSFWKLERDALSPTSPAEASVLSFQA